MAITAKLVNPTPWEQKLNFKGGINIRIPAFGETDLTMEQMDDYRPDKPGSEDVYRVLNVKGLFLKDSDLSYDHQALDALKKMREALSDQYRNVERRAVDNRSAQGISVDPEAIEAHMNQLGYDVIRENIKILAEQIKTFEKAVEGQNRHKREGLDPKRTIFALNPPREFPSIAAMEFFLEQNPEVAKQHRALQQRQAAEGSSDNNVSTTLKAS